MVENFKGAYDFCSNFYDAPVKYRGILYKHGSEAAYQSMKCKDPSSRIEFADMTATQAKKAGKEVKIRGDFEEIKLQIMYEIVMEKFKQNPELKQKLINTGNEELVEGNWWNDTFWGKCKGHGQNYLGKILMELRTRFRTGEI